MMLALVGLGACDSKPPGNTVPAVSVLPSISGEAREEAELTGSAGTWTGSNPVTTALQWQRCDASGESCADLEGATGARYVLAEADLGHRVRLRVQASNPAGTATAESAPTDVVGPVLAPTLVSSPAVEGSASLSSVLTARPGTWNPTPRSYAYQWSRCDASGSACVPLAGATASTYTVTSTDLDHTLVVTVTASNKAGSSSARSAPTPAVGFPPSCVARTATAGPLLPSVVETLPGTRAWTNAAWATTADGQSATVSLTPGDSTDRLVLQGFGLALPSNAKVTGLEVGVTRSSSSGAGIEDVSITLRASSSYEVRREVPGAPWPAGARTVVFGGPADLWSSLGIWPVTAFNSPDFSVGLELRHAGTEGTDLASIDGVQVKVYYTTASELGPASPTTVVDEPSRGTVAWSNPQAAATSGAPAATVSLTQDSSHLLKATGFGLVLPAGKTPSGVKLQLVRSSSGSLFYIYDEDVRLVVGGTVGEVNRRNFQNYTATPTQVQYGNALDTWGVALSAADVASPDFGVAISARNLVSISSVASIDDLRLTVLYDPVEASVTATPSTASQVVRSSEWVEPSNALSVDGVFTYVNNIIKDESSDELVLRSFGFNLPSTALVLGIQLDVARAGDDGIEDKRVQLVSGGSRRGRDLANPSTPWSGEEGTVQYGGSSERWGRFWEASELNDPGFGVLLSAVYRSPSGNGDGLIDGVTATVTYCVPQ